MRAPHAQTAGAKDRLTGLPNPPDCVSFAPGGPILEWP